VWVSLIGQPGERAATLAALRRAMPYVRRELGGRIRLRRIPELHVDVDESVERGTRVLQLLHELEEGRSPEELPPPSESLPTPTPRAPVDAPRPARRRRPGPPSGREAGPRRQGPRNRK
jgi:hypothetical protein